MQPESSRVKKRTRQQENWVRRKKQIARNSKEARRPPKLNCQHGHNLTDNDVRYFFDQLYSNRTKIDQDNFLLRFIKLKKKKQLRPRVQNPRARAVIEYSILKENGEQVPVCVKSFLSVASITMDRLKGLRKFMKASSDVKRKENRGGPRVKQEQISVTRSIINHISKFKTVESHYGRGKSVR